MTALALALPISSFCLFESYFMPCKMCAVHLFKSYLISTSFDYECLFHPISCNIDRHFQTDLLTYAGFSLSFKVDSQDVKVGDATNGFPRKMMS